MVVKCNSFGINGMDGYKVLIEASMSGGIPGFDMVGPAGNFAAYSNFSKLVLSLAMLMGRLEIFPLLIAFIPSTWKKNR